MIRASCQSPISFRFMSKVLKWARHTLPAEDCQLANVSILHSRERVLVLLTAWLYVWNKIISRWKNFSYIQLPPLSTFAPLFTSPVWAVLSVFVNKASIMFHIWICSVAASRTLRYAHRNNYILYSGHFPRTVTESAITRRTVQTSVRDWKHSFQQLCRTAAVLHIALQVPVRSIAFDFNAFIRVI